MIRERLICAILGPRAGLPPDAPHDVLPPEVVLRRGRLVPWIGGFLARMKGPASAVTLGRTIVINPETVLTPTLLTHELVHVRQWRRDPLFPIRYTLATIRYGYRNNPYEVEARGLASSEWPASRPEERIA